MTIFTFRNKLLLAMMLVVTGLTTATLFTTEQSVRNAFRKIFDAQFRRQLNDFSVTQKVRLAGVQARCLQVAQSVRVFAALEEGDSDDLYSVLLDELQVREGVDAERSFVRFLDADGRVLPTTLPEAGTVSDETVTVQLHNPSQALKAENQIVTYVSLGDKGKEVLHEVVATRIDDQEQRLQGVLIIGFPLEIPAQSGIFFMNKFFAPTLSVNVAESIGATIGNLLPALPYRASFTHSGSEESFRVFYSRMQEGEGLEPTYRVVVYSLTEAQAEQYELRLRIVVVGVICLSIGFVISLLLAQGLSGPVNNLVSATEEIKGGNYDYRVQKAGSDEMGQLARSFNEMAEGLAQKERYRSVLNMVADEQIANELLMGRTELGGEARTVSVIFCDIRGFTEFSENLDPSEVIDMLNEHMTALTRVVHKYGGAVDKFVGDLIMAVFGAPLATEQDAQNAASCALEMIAERMRLNETSRHKVEMGIGLATGVVVAGCMGSVDRLNYTVLGERVNLASRLCSKAVRGEILIDEATEAKLDSSFRTEVVGELQLKGFTAPVKTFKLVSRNEAI